MDYGGIDRVVRILVGLALLLSAVTHAAGAWAWVGVVPLMTGIIGWCPAYLPFGIKTCRMRRP